MYEAYTAVLEEMRKGEIKKWQMVSHFGHIQGVQRIGARSWPASLAKLKLSKESANSLCYK